MKILTSVYKTTKQEGMYLYVLKQKKMQCVPDALKKSFGKPLHVMDLLISPERKLAYVSAKKVINALESTGYYLQMPPPLDDYIAHIPNELLTINKAI